MNIVRRIKATDWTTIRYTYDPSGRRMLESSLVARMSVCRLLRLYARRARA